MLNEIQLAYAASEMIKIPNLNFKQPMSGEDVAKLLCYEMPKE